MTLKQFISNGHEQYGLMGGRLRSSGRFEDLSDIPNPMRRIGARAVDASLYLGSNAVVYARTKTLAGTGVIKIGQGVESKVFLDCKTSQVTKYNTGSIWMTDRERREGTLRKQEEFDLLNEQFSAYVLSQTIGVGPYVLSPSRNVIQTLQPYVPYNRFLVPDQNTPNIAFPPDTDSHARDQLSDFIDRAWELYSTHNLLPDTNGFDNVVTNEGGNVTLIDTQPISAAHPIVQETIKAQLDTLGRALASV